MELPVPDVDGEYLRGAALQKAVGKGGVVRDPEERERAIEAAIDAARALGFELCARDDSVITGPKGNRETFIWLRRSEAEPAP